MEPNWRDALDERARKSIAFAETYVRDFNHGAVGHNDLNLIAKLAELLDVAMGLREPSPPLLPTEVKLTFGKYSGETLGQLLHIDRGYLEWLAWNAREESLRSMVNIVLHDSPAVSHDGGPLELPF